MHDPLIVSSMRKRPTGIVEFLPSVGPKSGTTTLGFLSEYDEAIRQARFEAYQEAQINETGFADPEVNPYYRKEN